MPISPELKRVYASAPQDTRFIDTLALWHSFWGRNYFLTNDTQPWIFSLETGVLVQFDAIPFAIVMPGQDGRGQQDLQIVIENIGREVMGPIEQASGRPSESIVCQYRVYLDRPNSLPQIDPPLELRLTNIVVGLTSITATGTRADTLNRAFPSDVYRAEHYPGLDR
jgi:Domain of unknown function (DUF1833)